ncbi:MAG: DEAD/DEAH box helicase [Spirochaetales bacterium]|nr:DEAD/DEAH box helicase [Spirochaetales bacterium]
MFIDSDFESLFSDVIWDRAQQYARSNRVTFLGVNRTGKDKNERYFFSVLGSGDNEYTVMIRPAGYRGEFEAKCDCPYDWDEHCKHVGAALITGVEQGIFSLIDYSGKRVVKPISGKKPGSQSPGDNRNTDEELLFDLSKISRKKPRGITSPGDVLNNYSHSRRDILFPGPPKVSAEEGGAAGNYTLVFLVEMSDAYRGRRDATTRDPLVVTPGARYIKKDGDPGRHESYRDSQNFLPLTDSERNLLTWLLDSNAKAVPFGYVLPHLVNNRNLRVVLKKNNSYTPVFIEELQGVRVSFEFGGLQERDAPFFTPRFVFESSGTQKDPVPADAIEYGESGIGPYFYTGPDNIIYYTKIDTLHARYLTRLLPRYSRFTLDEIWSLSDALTSSFLQIVPPDGKIAIKRTQPALALYLEARSGGIVVHPALSYGSRTIESRLDAALVTDTRIDDTLHVHRRDFPAERALLEWFLELCANDFSSFHGYSLQMDIPEFLFRYGETCFDAGVGLFLKGDNKPIRQAGSFNIVASSGIDWLDLKIRIENHDVSPGDIDLIRGTVSVNGEYRLLDMKTLERLRLLYKSGKRGKESIQISRFDLATISQIEDVIEAGDNFDLTRIRSAISRLNNGFDTKRFRLPRGMIGTLRPYQKSGVKWLQFLAEFGFGGILADDMGLGKTIQAIALLAHLKEQGVPGPYLVVAPVSTIPNWIREIGRFLPAMPAYPHIGPERPANRVEVAAYRGVVVTSYHTLQRDIDLFEPVTWSQLILDESQALKNPAAKSHKTVRQLHFDRVLAMSGTPVENNIQELWSIMSILNPGLLGSKTDFLRRFRKRISTGDENTIETLRAKLRPFLLRRTKEQVAADLPAKDEVSIDVSLSSVERQFYNALKGKLRDEVQGLLASSTPFMAANAILTALTKLRQAAIAPSLVGGPAQSSKLDAVIEKLDESVSKGHKILVFSQYVRILQMLKERVEQERWAYCYLDGSISSGKRKTVIDEFQNNPEVSVFLISLKAGGVGINLTEADYVFLVDPWWNPAVESQAIDRTHRIGQSRPVFAYRFISEDTIEQRILELQDTKRELVKNVIGEDTSMFKSLSKDEIVGLFE